MLGSPPRKVGSQDTLVQARRQWFQRACRTGDALPFGARWWFERPPSSVPEEYDVARGEPADQTTPWNHRHGRWSDELTTALDASEGNATGWFRLWSSLHRHA